MSIDLPGFTPPTVGRVVHFYDTTLPPNARNGVGQGPYAATIAQVFPTGRYVNLLVLDPFCEPLAHWEGTVEEGNDGTRTRYWVWPPRA